MKNFPHCCTIWFLSTAHSFMYWDVTHKTHSWDFCPLWTLSCEWKSRGKWRVSLLLTHRVSLQYKFCYIIERIITSEGFPPFLRYMVFLSGGTHFMFQKALRITEGFSPSLHLCLLSVFLVFMDLNSNGQAYWGVNGQVGLCVLIAPAWFYIRRSFLVHCVVRRSGKGFSAWINFFMFWVSLPLLRSFLLGFLWYFQCSGLSIIFYFQAFRVLWYRNQDSWRFHSNGSQATWELC